MRKKKVKLTPEQDALERAAGTYICDGDDGETPVDQYVSLWAFDTNSRKDLASDYAKMVDGCEYDSVETVVSRIEGLRDDYMDFLNTHRHEQVRS